MFRRNAGGVPAGCAASDRLALGVIGVVSAVVVIAVAVLLLGGRAHEGADVAALPALNAVLNGLSAALLTAGYVFIRRRRVAAHLACMVSAFGVSTLFLISYVVYHYHAGSRPFTGPASVRPLYLLLLLTHVVLAAVILPLALTTIYRALSAQFVRHVAIARWTLPLWLYVSITGVIIYWMLYHL
jgi:putative membrane protein